MIIHFISSAGRSIVCAEDSIKIINNGFSSFILSSVPSLLKHTDKESPTKLIPIIKQDFEKIL